MTYHYLNYNIHDLNEPTRVWIRRYLTALFKEALGRVRGKFQGALKVPDAELTMDYDSLLNEGKEEQIKLLEQLDLRLERLSNVKQLENKGLEAENLNKSLGYRPLGLLRHMRIHHLFHNLQTYM